MMIAEAQKVKRVSKKGFKGDLTLILNLLILRSSIGAGVKKHNHVDV
jgi:hypothetical protein